MKKLIVILSLLIMIMSLSVNGATVTYGTDINAPSNTFNLPYWLKIKGINSNGQELYLFYRTSQKLYYMDDGLGQDNLPTSPSASMYITNIGTRLIYKYDINDPTYTNNWSGSDSLTTVTDPTYKFADFIGDTGYTFTIIGSNYDVPTFSQVAFGQSAPISYYYDSPSDSTYVTPTTTPVPTTSPEPTEIPSSGEYPSNHPLLQYYVKILSTRKTDGYQYYTMIYTAEKLYILWRGDGTELEPNSSEGGLYSQVIPTTYISKNKILTGEDELYNHNWYGDENTNIINSYGMKFFHLYSNNYNIQIVDSNYDIPRYNALINNGGINTGYEYDSPTDTTYTAPVTSKTTINFILPTNNYQSTNSYFEFRTVTEINDLDITSFDINKLTTKIYLQGSIGKTLAQGRNIIQKGERLNTITPRIYKDFGLVLSEGKHNVLYEVYYDEELIGSATVTVEKVVGFIDTNGDGTDDRTGTAFEGVTNGPYDAVADMSIEAMIDSAKTMFNTALTSINFIGSVFNILPTPIPQVISFILAISIVFFILKLVRG